MVVTDDGESVRMIFEHTEKDTLAFECLSHVGKLTDDDIKAAIAEVPRHSACGSPQDALERNLNAIENYYVSRLRSWKKLLSEAEESELQQTV